MQLSRDYKAITAVISLATNHAEACGGRICNEGKLCDRRAGVLHQPERGHSKLLGGYAINLAHLGRCDDLHGSYQLSAVSHQLKSDCEMRAANTSSTCFSTDNRRRHGRG